ncbi:hypothetical protein GALL_536530 [mine drainage metagenome]|uniref:Uncharacterized protein n=1 Tax=mine drainage metagenome TaxID=410659 RepID=A0A1J5PHP0_9ZZZZ
MVASISLTAWSRSRINADPDWPPVTWRAGHPILISMISAPADSAMRAPSAIHLTSQPASCTTCGAIPVASHRSRDMGRPFTRSSLAVISETTSPAPSAAVRRRKGASVTPDMGARKTRLATRISPIFNGLRGKSSKPVTDFSSFQQTPHRICWNPFCAQMLCSQVPCLQFRQIWKSCKCTATKSGFPHSPWESFCFRRASMIRAELKPPTILPVIESYAETSADCSHPRRSRTRPSCWRGGTEAIPLHRRADRDFPGDGSVLPPS